MSEHRAAAFRLAYLLMGDADEADDVAQEAFIRAYRALDRFDPARPMRPWLMRIVTNLARNRRRSVGRYLAALGRLLRAEPEPVLHNPGRPGPEAEALEVWEAVRHLNENDQRVIYLRYFLEMPEAEMAEALGIAPGTVKSRLHRALQRLRPIVEHDYPHLRTELADG